MYVLYAAFLFWPSICFSEIMSSFHLPVPSGVFPVLVASKLDKVGWKLQTGCRQHLVSDFTSVHSFGRL